MILLLLFFGGIVTILNPCVLPLVPIVINSSFQEGRFAPLALIAGLVISFSLAGTLIILLSYSFGLEVETVRLVGGLVLFISGLSLVSTLVMKYVVNAFSLLSRVSFLNSVNIKDKGLLGQVMLGFILGIVWSPCTGPSLGAAIGLASQASSLFEAIAMMFIFSFGVSLPLIFIAYSVKGLVLSNHNFLKIVSVNSRYIMGWIILIVGLAIVSGFDKYLELLVLNNIPVGLILFSTSF